jgi:hypothetical protein
VSDLWQHMPATDFDDGDRVETRGRPKKEPVPGAKKFTVELTPDAQESIALVKEYRRSTGFPVGSTSEIVCEALAGQPLRVATGLRAAFANYGDLLPAAHRAAALKLPQIEGVTVQVDAKTATAIDVICDWFRKRDRLFVSQAELVQAVLLNVSDSICTAEASEAAEKVRREAC